MINIKKINLEKEYIHNILDNEFNLLGLEYNSDVLNKLLSEGTISIWEFIEDIYYTKLLDIIDYINQDKNNEWCIDILDINEKTYNNIIINNYDKENISISIILLIIKNFSFLIWEKEEDQIKVKATNMSAFIKYFIVKLEDNNYYFIDNNSIYEWSYWEAPFFMVKLHNFNLI